MISQREEDESYQWWANFLDARVKALHAMRRLGKTPEEMTRTLNFSDEHHAQRIIAATLKDHEP